MRWIDLTHPVRTGMWTYPGDPVVRLDPAATIETDGSVVTALHLGSHSGTHLDAPSHVLAGAPTLDELPLSRFTGPTVVVDLRHLAPGAGAGVADLAAVTDRLAPGVVVLLATGWDRYWDDESHQGPDYLDQPYLSAEAAQALVDAGVRTVGIDAASIDAGHAQVLTTHLVLAAAGGVIVENLTGVTELLAPQADGAAIEVTAAPLRIAGGDGSPVRAIARVSDAQRPAAPVVSPG